MNQNACSVTSLSVSYDVKKVVTNISFDVPKGVVLGIIGPNGAGKSTLIKGMLGLAPHVTGSVTMLGQPLRKVRPRVAYMPQSLSLDLTFPVTVLDVVLMGTYPLLGWIRRPHSKQKAQANAALKTVGLERYSKHQIGELSGGQRQRVFLARALAQNPELLIMDEPFQGVDAASEKSILQVFHSLRETGASIIMVHHDLATVPEYCDMVALINRSLYAYGKTADVFTPENLEAVYGFPGTSLRRGLDHADKLAMGGETPDGLFR